jgi:hypothetical protein
MTIFGVGNARREDGTGNNGKSMARSFQNYFVTCRRARVAKPYFSLQHSLSVSLCQSIRPLEVDGAPQMGDESRNDTTLASMYLPTSLPSTHPTPTSCSEPVRPYSSCRTYPQKATSLIYAAPDHRCPRPHYVDSCWRVSTIVTVLLVSARAHFIVRRLGARENKGKTRHLTPGPGDERRHTDSVCRQAIRRER